MVFVACSSDVVCVATSRGYLLRYHWDDYGNEKGGGGMCALATVHSHHSDASLQILIVFDTNAGDEHN